MLALSRERLKAIAAVVLIFWAALDFLAEARPDTASHQRQATISGQVRLIGAEGEMAASASVAAIDTATDLEVTRTRTDTDGRFRLIVAPGRYLITASQAGFLVSSHGSNRYGLPGSPVVVAAGDEINVHLPLERASVIAGVVRDDRGTAIVNAVIEVFGRTKAIDAVAPISIRTRTDDNGAYRVPDVSPGSYTIVVMPPPPPTLPTGGRVRPYWPAGIAREVIIAAGENVETGFFLQRRPVTQVSVSLKSPPTVNVAEDVVALVSAVDGTAPTLSEVQALSNGQLVTMVHPGRYRLDVRVTGWSSDLNGQKTARPYFGSVAFEVEDASSQTLALQLSESVEFAGQVVGFGSADYRPSLRFVPMFGRAPVVRFHDAAISETGRFSVQGLAAGRYRLEWAEPDRNWTLNQLLIHGRPQRALEIDLQSKTPDDVEIAVAAASSIWGTIADPSAPSYLVLLVSHPNTSDRTHLPAISVARPDSKGGFRFIHQKAGAYRLLLVKDVELTELTAPAFIDSLLLAPEAISLVLVPGVATTIDLKIG